MSKEVKIKEGSPPKAVVRRDFVPGFAPVSNEEFAAGIERRFRDAVIAGLRDRGWPEPSENSSPTCPIWQSVEYGPPIVECELKHAPDNIMISFEASDRWVGGMVLGIGMAVVEIVEAIDRLRWVIGLPPLRTERYCGVEGLWAETNTETPEKNTALKDYWAAKTPAEEHWAYVRYLRAGGVPAYGETPEDVERIKNCPDCPPRDDEAARAANEQLVRRSMVDLYKSNPLLKLLIENAEKARSISSGTFNVPEELPDVPSSDRGFGS